MRILALLVTLLIPALVRAGAVEGLLTGPDQQPLPFATVVAEGTSLGTVANASGHYRLNLSDGTYRLAFHLVGYETAYRTVAVFGTVRLDVSLEAAVYQLGEVNIRAGENPADSIVRRVIARRKFYRDQVNAYSCDAYTKFLQKMASYPKKILGQEVDLSEELDSTSGILYLSESVSRLSFRAPSDVHEEMISSRVSGHDKAFSFNQAGGLLFNFYENLVEVGDICPRGIVSPVADGAFFYYRYRYGGVFTEKGVTLHRIDVVPRRGHDPVFSGTMYIQDSTWRIQRVDLLITRPHQLRIVDSLYFHQEYIPVTETVWMPFSARVDFVFNFLGFRGSGYFLGICSNYDVDPQFPRGFFDGAILKVDAGANKKDSVYWEQVRKVPLAPEEFRDYTRRDSTAGIRSSKAYLDSVDRKNNRLKPGGLLLGGYTWQNSFAHRTFSVSPLISSVSFNTVQGWNAGLGISHRRGDEEEGGKVTVASAALRYGFSDQRLDAVASWRRLYRPLKQASYSFSAGVGAEQFNGSRPVSGLVNMFYSLLAEKNYMKLYENAFVRVSHTEEVRNGLTLDAALRWERRTPLVNTTTYTWHDVENRDYTSNNPLDPASDAPAFERHEALIAGVDVEWIPGQRYILRPNEKINLGSDWPFFRFSWTGGFRSVLGSDVSFHRLECGTGKHIGLGLAGKLELRATAGFYPESDATPFMDARHFDGNQTFISDFRADGFNRLAYYDYSTTDSYFTASAEQDFGGLLLNKIPLIRQLKLNEIASFRVLKTSHRDLYSEASVGIEKLGILRADVVFSFSGGAYAGSGFVIGIKIR